MNPFRLLKLLLAIGILPALLPRLVIAAGSTNVFEETYTKHEFRIPMRDGVKLFTIVYTPKDISTNYPILLQRTPYNLKPYTVDAGGKPGTFPDSYVRE